MNYDTILAIFYQTNCLFHIKKVPITSKKIVIWKATAYLCCSYLKSKKKNYSRIFNDLVKLIETSHHLPSAIVKLFV